MIEHVSLEAAGLDEGLLAMFTLVRTDSSVNSHMTIERPFETESRRTFRAEVRLLARVDSTVF